MLSGTGRAVIATIAAIAAATAIALVDQPISRCRPAPVECAEMVVASAGAHAAAEAKMPAGPRQ